MNQKIESAIHPNEPSLPNLLKLRKELEANMKEGGKDTADKLEALNSQIKRHEAAAKTPAAPAA